MEAFVVDASIAVAWLHRPQMTPVAESAFQAVLNGALPIAPSVWPLEVANTLLVLERRGRITGMDKEKALVQIREFQIELDFEGANLAFKDLSTLAQTYKISVYDASYLELATRLQLPLACKDGPLREAARKAFVPLRD